ncbi:uncharacterized protein LOC131942287 [Physella acuta]|uniref:uncharacterized protein LOC131942287 n=1 Tax=Physella acuta TaxID=109671 RepID=UPI0027DE13DE|nr:uncharacterized protein LOC131942287 [Physella acuta]
MSPLFCIAVIEDDSVGVCGGIFCSDDSECPDVQICCASACGGQLCTNPVNYHPKCGVCPDGQDCVNTGIVCVRSPCPGEDSGACIAREIIQQPVVHDRINEINHADV